MKKPLLLGFLLAGLGLTGCEYNKLSDENVIDELLLVPKEQTAQQKVKTAFSPSPYSCLISTLAADEADYNYWNQAFWVHFPRPAVEQANGKTIFKAFSYGSERAGRKAGSWAGKDNIVRVAQCMIPDSKLAETLLEEQLKKFGEDTWLENRKAEQENSSPKGIQAKSKTGDWECGEWYVVYLCKYDEETDTYYDCVQSDPICAYYVYVEGPDPGGGGGDSGGGFPGDDPGECDPQGTEPCFEDGGGGSIPPPPPPDPCEENNPPAYCECEDTGNSVLDNTAVQMTFEDLWDKQLSSGKEQGGFLYENDLTDEWQFFELTDDWVRKRTLIRLEFYVPSNLPGGSIYIHTHPTQSSLTNFGINREYQHKPSGEDSVAMVQMSSNHGVAYGVIIDPVYRILVGPNGNEIMKAIRCGY